MKLVLASGSVWRKELLSWLGVSFESVESGYDETRVVTDDPEELVTTLAFEKANKAAQDLDEGMVIGADTVIVLDEDNSGKQQILGKPKNVEEARAMMVMLRGREHTVYTGLAVLDVTTGEKWIEMVTNMVRFKNFSDQVLEDYLKTDVWQGKAGAYQLLAIKDRFLESVEGSVTGLIGLPLKLVASILEEVGIETTDDLEALVWEKTGYPD